MIKVYITGFIILVSAIMLNLAAGKFGLTGWYDFLTGLASDGKKVFEKLSFMDYFWLVFLYPFLLGCSVILADKLFRLAQP